jgi:hypothetical protein
MYVGFYYFRWWLKGWKETALRWNPVDHRIALAGEDVVAVDSMCSRLMGIPLEKVGYLNYLQQQDW